jgi:hypothetical protein
MTGAAFGFTDVQWETLKRGPLYMLACVGGADARIDAAEWAALLDAVMTSSGAEDELVRGVMSELAAELRSGAAGGIEGDALAGLTDLRDIVGAWSAEGLGLRTTLMEIGATIAASSGQELRMTYASRRREGGGWRLSSGTSPQEQAALDAAALALNLAVALDEGADEETAVVTS